jgi:hypothetical protein
VSSWDNSTWYQCPEPYETGGIHKDRESLDELNPYVCPHCGSNHCSIQRERNDIYCFICGWRDPEYYNVKLNRLIEWLNIREKEIGSPVLLSDKERKIAEYKSERYQLNKESIDAKSAIYNSNHIEAVREYKRIWKANNTKKRKMLLSLV